MRFRSIVPLLRRLFHSVQTGTKSFIYNRSEWFAQFGRELLGSVAQIVIY